MDKQNEIVAGYYDGKSVIDLAKEYNLSRERIYQYLRQAEGWEHIVKEQREIRKKAKLLSYAHLLPKSLELREQGMSVGRIAKELGTTHRVISWLIKGTPLDNSKKARARRDKKINRDYIHGMSQVELARKYNLYQTRISAILHNTNNGKLPQRLVQRPQGRRIRGQTIE